MHTSLKCAACGRVHAIDRLQNVCESCGRPLLADYPLDKLAATFTPDVIRRRTERSLWKFAEVLPIDRREDAISLGEGLTPLLSVRGRGPLADFRRLFVKDESLNPTGSFKARGMSAAITRAEGARSQDRRLAVGGKRGRRGGGLCGTSRPHLSRADARGHADRQRGRSRRRRGACRPGERSDQRLRQVDSQGMRPVRLVRPVDSERALPRRGQKDDGLRAGLRLCRRSHRPLAAARRHFLSDRRRDGPDRHVESLRRNGTSRLDRFAAAADGCRASRKLCADRAGLRARSVARRDSFPTHKRLPRVCACRQRSATF